MILLIAALAAQAPAPASEAEVLYGYHCKSCHEPGQPGAPDREVLRKMGAAAILKSLDRGHMKVMGSTLTADQKKQVAAFIVGARPPAP